METQIADIKIADRARDLLDRGSQGGEATRVLSKHIDSALTGRRLRDDLQSKITKYAALLDERRTVARAKYLLQQKLACGEEQMYLYLRNTSRRCRKPMQEVGENLLEEDVKRLEQLSA